MAFHHVTVLRDEAAALLCVRPGMTVLDGTLGGGGHSELLLAQGARVVGIDRDRNAIEASRARLVRFGDRFRAVQATFSEARQVLSSLSLGGVDGLLLDLGVSSPQFDDPARGFSFSHDGPLDMRMGETGETAAELIARLSESELSDLIFQLGEERFARRIARAVKAAPNSPTTTSELAEIVSSAVPHAPQSSAAHRIHPATRTFQALRIAVNGELDELDAILADLPALLNVGGRAAVISFHSLEDRRVKERFRSLEGRCTCPPGLPVCACGHGQRDTSFRVLTKKPICPGEAEIAANPRARSAHLRGLERLK